MDTKDLIALRNYHKDEVNEDNRKMKHENRKNCCLYDIDELLVRVIANISTIY